LDSRAMYEFHPLSHFNDRPEGVEIDTIVIHSMYCVLPRLGTPFSMDACLRVLDEEGVSSHFMIGRDGTVWQIVKEDDRAWHAGESKMPEKFGGRENVNDFSIGIELIASPRSGFTDSQYDSLISVTNVLLRRLNIRYVLGHEHIAPQRKVDPGELFDWNRYMNAFPDLIWGVEDA
ncbi:MAG: hypothetical protein D6808_01900, partial [Candidatus Dadabacteria bacterium]